jgi:hypothetical protein
MREKGGPNAFTHLPGDLSVLEADRLLVVPSLADPERYPEIRLPKPWDTVAALAEQTDGSRIERDADGAFHDVPAGIYRME